MRGPFLIAGCPQIRIVAQMRMDIFFIPISHRTGRAGNHAKKRRSRSWVLAGPAR